MKRFHRYGALALAVFVFECGIASAQSSTALERCKTIADPQQRLACYDAAITGAPVPTPSAAPNQAPRATGPVAPQPHDSPSPAADSLANFSPPPDHPVKGGERTKPKPPRAPNKVVANLRSAQFLSTGALLVELEDTELWLQTDSYRFPADPAKARMVTLTRDALGTYFMRLDNAPVSVRAKRLR